MVLLKPFVRYFPQFNTQICVVHQIRNTCKYVVWKDKKPFAEDMKPIYSIPNKQTKETELTTFELKWGTKYSYAIRSRSIN
ncbi:hypothetical protein C1634_024195 [Chryseobacterium viscerum]|uniref:Mutator family transposase n=1 Tax=Chryseobacterium viscerum TaxID=1037377 RepID=A0A316W9R0_9FLAO|nr:hypothetical protein C1634_024195 [Chryseobacterium viscerum]